MKHPLKYFQKSSIVSDVKSPGTYAYFHYYKSSYKAIAANSKKVEKVLWGHYTRKNI